MLVLVQNGASSGLLTPIISVLIILGSISTAVNMISGIVTRCVNAVERRMKSEQERQNGHFSKCRCNTDLYIFSICDRTVWIVGCCKTDMRTLDMQHLSSLFIPFIIHVIVTKGKRDLKFILGERIYYEKLGLTIFPRKARKIS